MYLYRVPYCRLMGNWQSQLPRGFSKVSLYEMISFMVLYTLKNKPELEN